MKYFAAIVLLALFAVAFIEAKPKPAEVENIEPESGAASPDMPRNKRLVWTVPSLYAPTVYTYDFYQPYVL